MLTQSHPSPQVAPFTASAPGASPAATGTPEQKSQAKALKKERKNERLRFFFGWCEGCQAFGSAF
ncbi:hypothetical protein [Hymenobacter rubidus]|uniref:hypothetical protein n=1 Tax=Hymenobacter rubidus TaxID=1441626 RepID=UPI00191F43DB|nr:hypothetical protein [Hymenobacter rubidus]